MVYTFRVASLFDIVTSLANSIWCGILELSPFPASIDGRAAGRACRLGRWPSLLGSRPSLLAASGMALAAATGWFGGWLWGCLGLLRGCLPARRQPSRRGRLSLPRRVAGTVRRAQV